MTPSGMVSFPIGGIMETFRVKNLIIFAFSVVWEHVRAGILTFFVDFGLRPELEV